MDVPSTSAGALGQYPAGPSPAISASLPLAPFSFSGNPLTYQLQSPDAHLPAPRASTFDDSGILPQRTPDEMFFLDPSLRPTASTSAEPLENDDAQAGAVAETETDASPSKEKRQVPSVAKPVYGFVDGVGRGNSICEIPRVRPLRKPIVEQTKSTERYRRLLKDVVCRAEALSEETGCWLYLAAQHPHSLTPFTHFASKRFRLEAAPELDQCHKHLSTAMSALLCASKRSRVEAEKARSLAEDRLADAEAHAAVVETDLAKARSEIEARDHLIASLLARNQATLPDAEA